MIYVNISLILILKELIIKNKSNVFCHHDVE